MPAIQSPADHPRYWVVCCSVASPLISLCLSSLRDGEAEGFIPFALPCLRPRVIHDGGGGGYAKSQIGRPNVHVLCMRALMHTAPRNPPVILLYPTTCTDSWPCEDKPTRPRVRRPVPLNYFSVLLVVREEGQSTLGLGHGKGSFFPVLPLDEVRRPWRGIIITFLPLLFTIIRLVL